MTFRIKRGDTSPSIKIQLRSFDGMKEDIRGYNSVEFFMRDESTGELIVSDNVSGNVEVLDAETGKIQYDWQSGDTDTAGLCEAEVEVEFNDGSTETYPNNSYIEVDIFEDIE